MNPRTPRPHKIRPQTSPVLAHAGLCVLPFEGLVGQLGLGLVPGRRPHRSDRADGHRSGLPRDGTCPYGGAAFPAGILAHAWPRVPYLVPGGSRAKISGVVWAWSRALPTSDPSCAMAMPQRNPWSHDETPSRQPSERFASSRRRPTRCRRSTLVHSSSQHRNQHRRQLLRLHCCSESAANTIFDKQPLAAGGGDFARPERQVSRGVVAKGCGEVPMPASRVDPVYLMRYVH